MEPNVLGRIERGAFNLPANQGQPEAPKAVVAVAPDPKDELIAALQAELLEKETEIAKAQKELTAYGWPGVSVSTGVLCLIELLKDERAYNDKMSAKNAALTTDNANLKDAVQGAQNVTAQLQDTLKRQLEHGGDLQARLTEVHDLLWNTLLRNNLVSLGQDQIDPFEQAAKALTTQTKIATQARKQVRELKAAAKAARLEPHTNFVALSVTEKLAMTVGAPDQVVVLGPGAPCESLAITTTISDGLPAVVEAPKTEQPAESPAPVEAKQESQEADSPKA